MQEFTEGTFDVVVTGGEGGVVESECYLVSERGGERSVRLLRRDRYPPAKDASGAS